MAIIKATPEVLAMKGILPALLVRYGTLVLKAAESHLGDPSGIIFSIKVDHKVLQEDKEINLLIENTEQGIVIHEQ